MPPKKKYIPNKTDEKEIQKFRDHLKMIDEKNKAIAEKYRTWWDKEKRTWKDGFSHGNKNK